MWRANRRWRAQSPEDPAFRIPIFPSVKLGNPGDLGELPPKGIAAHQKVASNSTAQSKLKRSGVMDR